MTPQILTFILDDNPDVQVIINAILKREGLYNIKGFSSPKEFKEALSNEVSLVLLDLNMPGYNYDVFQLIKYIQKSFTGIHIIVISGYLNEQIKDQLWEAEVFFAVDKNGHTFPEDLKKTLDRVAPRILLKLDAVK